MSRAPAFLFLCAAAAVAVAVPAPEASAQVSPVDWVAAQARAVPPPWWPPPFVVWYPAPAPSPPSPTPPVAPTPPPRIGVPPVPADAWPGEWARMEDEVLTLTNQARAKGAECGDKSFGPAGPLALDGILRIAAREHSRDMGAGNYFEHVSLDGRSPTDRMHAAGWKGRTSGENIYGGQKNGGTLSAAEVVDGWMHSPGHCSNIMDPRFKTIGVGYAATPRSRLGNYWTQDFGG